MKDLDSILYAIGRFSLTIIMLLLIWTPLELIARWAWRLSRLAVERMGP